MVVYSVHIQVEPDIENTWLKWMLKKHIPDVMNVGIFTHRTVIKLHIPDSSQYRIDYFADSLEKYHEYQQKYAKTLQEEHLALFGDKTKVHSRTIGIIL
ncbi:MAG: DUF4286 family protein [Bacteroidia bacterium]|nr:DUF4286 family protein [Bacteroidia bacterium]MDW8348392.1 DUF4286 family protein [Bacteroidia bacterium]